MEEDEASCSEPACLNGAELLVGFVGSRARLCALAPLAQ